jgi:hypothetical protein
VNLINQGKPGKPSLKISYWYNKKTVEKLLYFTWLEARYITIYHTILGVVVSKNSVPVFEVFSCFFLFFLVFSCFFSCCWQCFSFTRTLRGLPDLG